jgi:transglutaminase-like putative cysteine protease
MDEQGYVWYEGRADDVIIAAGYRIGPFEVESACLEHPAVREAAAVASPDERRGNVVKAFVVAADGWEPGEETAKAIQEHVRKHLSAYAYPRRNRVRRRAAQDPDGQDPAHRTAPEGARAALNAPFGCPHGRGASIVSVVATAVNGSSAPVRERRPGALMPTGTARLVGYVLLALLGALEWQRMVDGLPAGHALLWVLVGTVAAAGVLACERLPRRWADVGTVAVAALALPAAWLAAGLDLGLLRESRWPELGDGVARGLEALSNVKLPYEGVDPWPARVIEASGALLCALAGLLSVWPRGRSNGYPFLALVALLVLVAVPVVSLGGTRPILLGMVLAALTVVFLSLERLPLRPGIGVAALLGLALAGALPIGAAADKEEPWFDYKAWAEGLGPEDPVRFGWEHGDYGPIDWGRTGAEVVRVSASRPSYWKVETLDGFDGVAWRESTGRRRFNGAFDELPDGFANQPGWRDELRVSVRRLRGREVIGAGTVLNVRDSTRDVRRGFTFGSFWAESELRRGDSYTADVYVPRPSPGQLAAARAASSAKPDQRSLRIPITGAGEGIPLSPGRFRPMYAEIEFTDVDGRGNVAATARYPQLDVTDDGDVAMRNSPYARTWRRALQLRRLADDPYEYVLAVNRYLQGSEFRYDERPAPYEPGVAPLEAFINDTKAGYCQHYSAAMAMLLRMGGVPARVATGFSPGGYSRSRDAWIVRDTDAHSWVEVWFEGLGWVASIPRPRRRPRAPDQRHRIGARSRRRRLVIDAGDAAGGAPTPAPEIRGCAAISPTTRCATRPRKRRWRRGAGRWLAIVGGLLGIGASGFGVLVWRARRGGGYLDPERAIAELQRALRRTGRDAPVGTTLAQLEQRLNLSSDAAGYVRALRAGRYAPAASRPSKEQRRALRRDLADGLGPAGRLACCGRFRRDRSRAEAGRGPSRRAGGRCRAARRLRRRRRRGS